MFSLRQSILRTFRRDEKAAAMVEFAIVVPLLFTLVFGIVDVGRAYFLYNNLTNAARDAARWGASRDETESGLTANIQALARAKINDDSASVAVVNVTYPLISGVAKSKVVRVTISSYPFQPVTYVVLKAKKRFTTTAEFRLEQQ
jgi:Flp pilus assembly protein TadG